MQGRGVARRVVALFIVISVATLLISYFMLRQPEGGENLLGVPATSNGSANRNAQGMPRQGGGGDGSNGEGEQAISLPLARAELHPTANSDTLRVTLHGRLLDEDGVPLQVERFVWSASGVLTQVIHALRHKCIADAAQPFGNGERDASLSNGDRGEQLFRTGAAGTFEVQLDLSAASTALVFGHEFAMPVLLELPLPESIRDDATRHLGDIRVMRAGVVVGRLTDIRGAPIRSARLRIVPASPMAQLTPHTSAGMSGRAHE